MLHNRYAHQVQEYNLGKIRNVYQKRQKILDALQTTADAQQYVDSVRRKIKKCFAPFPKKTPMHAQICGTHTNGNILIEKILYQSRPHFYVTANLYIPQHISGKMPAVLGLCGHSPDGKAEASYHNYALALASKGFLVLVIDPIAQGERQQFFKRDGGTFSYNCEAHNQMGNQMLLLNDFFGTWRVWDAIRGLDYLLARPEADRSRVGVTGNSGGGTLTSYVSALDPRITMSAPSCYICSIEANVANEVAVDSEQNPPGFIAAGLDHIDLLIAAAPRPTLILGQKHDFFSARHTEKAAKELKRIHALLGNARTADYYIDGGFHGYSQANVQHMVNWFMKHAQVKGPRQIKPLKLSTAKELQVTTKGIISFPDAKRVFEFTAESAAELARKRKALSIKSLQRIATKLLQLPQRSKQPIRYRALAENYSHVKNKNPREAFAVETEPGIQTLLEVHNNGVRKMLPPSGDIHVSIGHLSSQDDFENIPSVRALSSGKKALVLIDPRGIGQSTAKSCGDIQFFHPYGADFMYSMIGDMSQRSYLGQRTHDILCCLDWLAAEGAKNITLHGRGINSISVAFAALLHPSKPTVCLNHYLPSYQLLADKPIFAWPASCLLRGVLSHFDLPDVYKALGKRLTLHKAWNHLMKEQG